MSILFVGDGKGNQKTKLLNHWRITEQAWILIQILSSSNKQVAIYLWNNLWSISPSYEDLDESCKPLVHWAAAKLEDSGIKIRTLSLPFDLTLKQLIGKIRHAWASNAIQLKKAQKYTEVLSSVGCTSVILKGVSSSIYDSVAKRGRTSQDVDLWIEPSFWSIAETALQNSGLFDSCNSLIRELDSQPERLVEVHAVDYFGPHGTLDLHQHPIPGFMSDLSPFKWLSPLKRNNNLYVPSLNDHLAISCLHAFTDYNRRTKGYLKYLADVLPFLSRLDNDSRARFNFQLETHGHHSQVKGQIWYLHRELIYRQETLRAKLDLV